nr:hypothetical protein [Tanacetum cinerariifolium]
VVTQIRTQALPGRDQYDQQRHCLQQLQIPQIGHIGEQGRFRVSQAVDKIFENAGQHRLSRGEDHEANDAEQKDAHVRFHVGQQSKIDFQAGGFAFFWRAHSHRYGRKSRNTNTRLEHWASDGRLRYHGRHFRRSPHARTRLL